MTDKIAEDELKIQDKLKSNRANWESLWQEITDLVLPRRGDFTTRRKPGEERGRRIYEGTAPHSNDLLASALHGMMTNPASKWFRFKLQSNRFNNIRSVKQWLQAAENITFFQFNRRQSNFSPSMHQVYLDQGAFGTSILFTQDINDGFRMKALHLGECYIQENENSVIDRLNRVFELSAIQAIATFGSNNVSDDIKKAFEADPTKMFPFLHVVKPREKRDPSKLDGANKKWASIFIDMKKKVRVAEGGFEEFPFHVPRWSVLTGEVYGRSPTMVVMADIRMVNAMMRTTIRGAQKVVDPPLLLPDEGVIIPVRTVPGGLNFGGINSRGQILVQPLNTNARIDMSVQFMEIIQTRIRNGYFIDQLQLQGGPQMTATEVLQRTEEKQRILGPVLGRQQVELLSPLLERVFKILQRQGRFPEPPPEIDQEELEIEYISPMAQAQRAQDAQGFLRTMEIIAPFAQIDPSLLDIFDPDATGRGISEINNVPFNWMRDPEQVEQIRAERKQQIEEQQALENTALAAKAAQSFGQADASNR